MTEYPPQMPVPLQAIRIGDLAIQASSLSRKRRMSFGRFPNRPSAAVSGAPERSRDRPRWRLQLSAVGILILRLIFTTNSLCCLALDNGEVGLALAIVDNIAIPREVYDLARTMIWQQVALPPDRILDEVFNRRWHMKPGVELRNPCVLVRSVSKKWLNGTMAGERGIIT
jgi:hypothetical protein